MLNHKTAGDEFSRMRAKSTAATKGKSPKIRLSRLYFPVRCIIHLHNSSIAVQGH